MGLLVFPDTSQFDDAVKNSMLSEYCIDCDGVLGTLLLPDSKHLLNLASCADRRCDANARLAYDRRFGTVSLKQVKKIRAGDQIKFWYGDEFVKPSRASPTFPNVAQSMPFSCPSFFNIKNVRP